MKNKLCLLVTSALLLSIFTGCNGVAAANQAESSSESPAESPADQAAEIVYGKIKEINGNEVLLAIGSMGDAERPDGAFTPPDGEIPDGERPSFQEGQTPGRGDRERPSFSEGERPSMTEGERPSFPENEQPSGERPSGGSPGGGGGQMPSRDSSGAENASPSRGQGQRPEQGRFPGGGQSGGTAGQESFALTGEEKIYLIPVTAPITAGQGETATELRFTQLAVKNVICLYLNDKGEIFSVQLLQ